MDQKPIRDDVLERVPDRGRSPKRSQRGRRRNHRRVGTRLALYFQGRLVWEIEFRENRVVEVADRTSLLKFVVRELNVELCFNRNDEIDSIESQDIHKKDQTSG